MAPSLPDYQHPLVLCRYHLELTAIVNSLLSTSSPNKLIIPITLLRQNAEHQVGNLLINQTEYRSLDTHETVALGAGLL